MNNLWVRWTLAQRNPQPRAAWKALAQALLWVALILAVMALPYLPVVTRES